MWVRSLGQTKYPGGEHGNPLQYSCLENPMGRGAWWAAVHRVTETDTTEWLTHTPAPPVLSALHRCPVCQRQQMWATTQWVVSAVAGGHALLEMCPVEPYKQLSEPDSGWQDLCSPCGPLSAASLSAVPGTVLCLPLVTSPCRLFKFVMHRKPMYLK